MFKRLVIAVLCLSLVLPLLCGCSQGSKKESYDREGPWHTYQGEGPYKKLHIKVQKAGDQTQVTAPSPDQVMPDDKAQSKQAQLEKMVLNKSDSPHPDPYPVNKPKMVKKKRVIVFTMNGDRYVGTCEEREE